MRIDSAIITGSFSVNGDTFNDLGAYTTTGSNTFVGDQSIVGAVSASALTGSISYTNLTDVPTLVSGSEQIVSILSPLNSYTQSNDSTNTAQNTRLTNLENKTGSLATTGSNIFYGNQTISGTVYIQSDLVVQGSSCIQNITGSSLNIGTNIVSLNTATPSVRYAGITVQDSGSSSGVTGSILWDSLCNRWMYSNPSTVGYSGGIIMSGPRAATLGTETTLTCNYIAKSGGGDHLYDSCIWEMSGSVGINTNAPTNSALHIISCWVSGNSTVKIQPNTGGTTAGLGVYDDAGTRKGIFYRETGYVAVETSAAEPLLLNTNGISRLCIGASGIITSTCQICANGFYASSVQSGVTIDSTTNGDTIIASRGLNAALHGIIRTVGQNGVTCMQIISTRNSVDGNLPASVNAIWGLTNSDMAIATNNIERMRIVSNGCVGIGTNSPNTILHTSIKTCYGTNGSVVNSYPVATFSQCDCAGGLRGLEIGIPTGGIVSPVYLKVANTGARFSILDSSNNEDLTITGGKVGIGVINPAVKLQINGSLTLKSNTNQSIQLWNSGSVAADIGGNLEFRGTYRNSDNDSVIYTKIFGGKENASDGNFAGYLAISTYEYPNSLSERVRISSSGKLGIGTSTPLAKLHINGTQILANGGDYGKVEHFSTQSSFSNPSVALFTMNATANYAQVTIKVRVFQNGVSQGWGNIHSGYAVFGYNAYPTVSTAYTSTMASEGGTISNVGSIAWYGTTLCYHTSRVTNYDRYHIVMEWGAVNMNYDPSYSGF